MKKPDRRDLPSYSLAEASHYLAIPASTIRYWSVGREGVSEALLRAAQRAPLALSFRNLVELHVLGAMRRHFEVSMPSVRKSLLYLKKQFHADRPLLDCKFETDGLHLFVERYGQLINATRQGQSEMREVLAASLKRIERDDHGIPIRLFPYTRNETRNAPRLVVIDPDISFGRPVIAGTGIPTREVAERFKAGESIDELARDYGRSSAEIDEAVRCEQRAA
ncbi:MAG: DUF433 domain-containing protein [Gammaproteobacteria bacterium]|nr:DUF433 domain-containing protein [Gammaproteobacteria bacterium]